MTWRATSQIPIASRMVDTRPTRAIDEGEVAGRGEGLRLGQLHDQGGTMLVQPPVDPDDRHAAVVRISAWPLLPASAWRMPSEFTPLANSPWFSRAWRKR